MMAIVACAAFCGLVWWLGRDVMDFSGLGDDILSDELDEETRGIDDGDGARK